MENAGYTTLTRQSGLMAEMRVVANNLANMSTTGYRKEGVIFSEYIMPVHDEEGSLSMATAEVRRTDQRQGPIAQTNGTFDLAIEGEGFFLVDTPNGQRLTRNGAFTPNGEGELVNPDGYRLLDAGGAPIFIPPDARAISIARDGTVSGDGNPLAQIGLYRPSDPLSLIREDGVLFRADGGFEPMEEAAMLQGFLEESNVDPVGEITRMIEVQRAYELGQNFLNREDERIRGVLQTLGR